MNCLLSEMASGLCCRCNCWALDKVQLPECDAPKKQNKNALKIQNHEWELKMTVFFVGSRFFWVFFFFAKFKYPVLNHDGRLIFEMPWRMDTLLNKISNELLWFLFPGLKSVLSTAGAVPTTTTQTSTILMRGMPNSTRRPSVSTANTRQRSNRTWREAPPSERLQSSPSLFGFLQECFVNQFLCYSDRYPRSIHFPLYNIESLCNIRYLVLN